MTRSHLLRLAAALSLSTTVVAMPAGVLGGTGFAERIHVDIDSPDTSGDGSSWSNAFKHLQDGLAAADAYLTTNSGPVEVWVAEGVYRPDRSNANPAGSEDRSATFQLRNYVSVFGGFAGTESEISERQLFSQDHESVLSGDLGVQGDPADNCYHVVTGTDFSLGGGAPWTNRPTLNGFTVREGNANGSGFNNSGGAFFSTDGRQVLAQCRFVDNRADAVGGALFAYLDGTSIYLMNCVFENNVAKAGGAGCALSQGRICAIQCFFVGNQADASLGTNANGGALYLSGTTSEIEQSTFVNNSAEDGGAIYLGYTSHLYVKNNLFWNNLATTSDSSAGYVEGGHVHLYDNGIEGGLAQVHLRVQTGAEMSLEGTVIEGDPAFVDADGGDWSLGLLSAVNDAGDEQLFTPDIGDIDQDDIRNEPTPLDLGLKPRVTGAERDLGAYEASCDIEVFCESLPNSSGATTGALISATGQCSVGSQDLTFTASPVPNTPGLFLLGETRQQLPFGDGFLCVGGEKVRLAPLRAESNTMVYQVDWSSPSIQNAIQLGSICHVQAWFRDPTADGSGFNTSNALTVQVQP